ncbi:MAG: class IV adenylate cyclase [Anaerolineae bacterium]|nr:class IV adenylate cyclase [Anaerolineae bacterium]
MSYQETEVKLYIPDHSAIEVHLNQLGAELTAPRVLEYNVRYENADETLTANGIVVRLRRDSRARLTYKEGGTVNNDVISRYEAEVEVSDFDTMDTLLDKLGYHRAMTYEKYRTTYELDNAEIVLDEMPYGNFVEIEGDADTIHSLLQQLDLDEATRYGASYTKLFERVKRHLGLTFRDLTFGNFEGIEVPTSAFDAD